MSEPHRVAKVEQPALLALRHGTVMRGEREALAEVTLEIAAGRHVCILGPNGCGKSTLIKTITRECYPLEREGSSMAILGKERWNIFELRSLLGVVSPDLLASCTSDATGRDVVLSGFSAAHEFFPIITRRRNFMNEQIARLAGWAFCISRTGRLRTCLRAKRNAH